jgi:hypothetical protein
MSATTKRPKSSRLRGLPKFDALMAEVEAEMAGQLANLREMEKRGELAAIPRNEVSLQ